MDKNLVEARVAIYCRLSQEDKNKKTKDSDSESIKNQKIMLMEYAREKEWKIVGVFVDEDWAGMNEKRPAYNKVLELASNGEIDIILCKSLNRFTRDSIVVEKYVLEKFDEWDVRFIGLVDNVDTKTTGNRKTIQINALMNQWYIEDMSDSIKAALTTKRKNGEYIGSTALYGYLKDPNNKGHLIIDPVASEVVKEIFRLYSEGNSKTSIARILNDRGIPNPTKYKIEQGIFKGLQEYNLSSMWKYFSISNILQNEMYIGNMVQGKYGSVSFRTKKNRPKSKKDWIIVEGTHEAIIDKELWNKVLKMRSERHRAYATGEIGIFSGKCRCEYCNASMKSMKSHGNRYFRCNTKYISSGSCIGSFISEKRLIQFVLKEVNSLGEKHLEIKETFDEIVELSRAMVDNLIDFIIIGKKHVKIHWKI